MTDSRALLHRESSVEAESHRAARDCFNARCSKCRRPIEWTSFKDEPMVCGPCLHRIGDEAKYRAIREARRG